MWHEETGGSILIGSDPDANFLISKQAGRDKSLDRGFPNSVRALLRISQFEYLRFGQNNTAFGSLTSGLEYWRIAFKQGIQAREDFIDRLIFVPEGPKGDLR